MKKATSFWFKWRLIRSKASPSMKSTAEHRDLNARRRLTSVSGYHLDATPRPFSPTFIRLAPGARIPPRKVLFRSKTWNARSTPDFGIRLNSLRTLSLDIEKVMILRLSSSCCGLNTHFHTALTSGSSSPSTIRSTIPSPNIPKGTLPPPAKGSTSVSSGLLRRRSQAEIVGTSQVFPPGYRNGETWWTDATFTMRASN
jgi:hypothetical protein